MPARGEEGHALPSPPKPQRRAVALATDVEEEDEANLEALVELLGLPEDAVRRSSGTDARAELLAALEGLHERMSDGRGDGPGARTEDGASGGGGVLRLDAAEQGARLASAGSAAAAMVERATHPAAAAEVAREVAVDHAIQEARDSPDAASAAASPREAAPAAAAAPACGLEAAARALRNATGMRERQEAAAAVRRERAEKRRRVAEERRATELALVEAEEAAARLRERLQRKARLMRQAREREARAQREAADELLSMQAQLARTHHTRTRTVRAWHLWAAAVAHARASWAVAVGMAHLRPLRAPLYYLYRRLVRRRVRAVVLPELLRAARARALARRSLARRVLVPLARLAASSAHARRARAQRAFEALRALHAASKAKVTVAGCHFVRPSFGLWARAAADASRARYYLELRAMERVAEWREDRLLRRATVAWGATAQARKAERAAEARRAALWTKVNGWLAEFKNEEDGRRAQYGGPEAAAVDVERAGSRIYRAGDRASKGRGAGEGAGSRVGAGSALASALLPEFAFGGASGASGAFPAHAPLGAFSQVQLGQRGGDPPAS